MFTDSPVVRRINSQCQIWIHKPTGVKYRKDTNNGAVNLMQALSAKPRYVTDEELNNNEIWGRA